jgi:hypothetical protein
MTRFLVESLRLFWEVIRQVVGLPGRWLCLAALAAGLPKVNNWYWLLALGTAWLLSITIPHLGLALTGLESATSFAKYIGQFPELKFTEEELPNSTEWFKRFWIWRWAPQVYPELRNLAPLRFFSIRSVSALKLMSFINPYGTSVVIGRKGPKDAIGPIEKFNVYHELGHCSFAGIDLWSRKISMSVSAIGGVLALLVVESTKHLVISSSALLCALGSIIYWRIRYVRREQLHN